MSNENDKPDYFQFRWGVKEWDVGFTTIPNPVLKHYAKVPWIDKDGKRGCGITNQEVLCIIHIASFHYESEQGEARPAIPTIRKRMGYKKDESISRLIKSLEDKNLLIVDRRSGKCNIYSLQNFSQAIVDMDNPPIPVGGSTPMGAMPVGEPIPVGDNPPIPVGAKNKIKNEKPKDEEKKTIISFSENSQPSSSLFQKGDDQLTIAVKCAAERQKAGGNYASPVQAGGSDGAAEAALLAIYRELGSEPPRRGTNSWKDELEIVGQVLRGRGLTDPAQAEEAGKLFGQANRETPQFANVHLSSFPGAFGIIVGKVKKQATDGDDTDPRRAGGDVEAMQAGLAALEERRAARPPPLEDDEVGQGVKAHLEDQVQRDLFRQYVEPTGFACQDGVLVATAPDEEARAWLEDHLGATIRRALAGVTDAPGEVVYDARK